MAEKPKKAIEETLPIAKPSAFTPPSSSIEGLATRFENGTPCRCGSREAIIGSSAGVHEVRLNCCGCSGHRGYLSVKVASFLRTLAERYGAPDAPVTLRRGQ